MVYIHSGGVTNSIRNLENILRELRRCIEEIRLAIKRLEEQSALENELMQLKKKLKTMQSTEETFRRYIMVLGRCLAVYYKSEQLIINGADSTDMAIRRYKMGTVNIDTGFIKEMGLNVSRD